MSNKINDNLSDEAKVKRQIKDKPINKKAMQKNKRKKASAKAKSKANTNSTSNKDELKLNSIKDIKKIFTKKHMLNMLKDNYKSFLTAFLINLVAIIYWECFMFIETGGIKLSSLFFIFFVPAQSLLLTFLCGWGKDIIAKICAPLVLLIVNIFYIVQLVYYRNFGSLFSVSMAGMGNDAVGNFWWALEDTLHAAIGRIILLLLPVFVVIILTVLEHVGKNKVIRIVKYDALLHIMVFFLAIIMWFVGILGIRLFGNDRQSAYFLFTDTSVNTDTSAKKLGVMTTSLVEAGAYYFGITSKQNEEFNITPIDNSYTLVKENINEDNDDEIVRTPWINEAIDFNDIASKLDDPELKSMAEYFATREPSYTNEYTGMFEGYNLIYICAESFWTYACNEKVTPTLYKMANNGIILNNYYNSLKNTTTNGEFAFTTSLWPDVSRVADAGKDVGSFPRSSAIYMPQGLGDLFTENNVPSYAFHNYYGKYYRRILSWPNLGYKCRFSGDNMSFTCNWPASDLELMEQTVDDYINDDVFHAYYMTFSGHGPYTANNGMYRKNIDEVLSIVGNDAYQNPLAPGYLACNMEFDKAMEYLLKRLEDAGKLEKTVIVIAGDHYPYYMDKNARTSLVGQEMDEDFDIYKSTCIIYNAGLSEPIYNDEYCCNVDIIPTILNLFNIPFDSRLYMGKDVFSNSVHRAALYNKSFITDMVKYNYETGETSWMDKSNSMSDDEKSKYLEAMISLVENEYMASCKLVSDNFYFHVYDKAGLFTEEEKQEELKREAAVQIDIDNYAAQDAALEAERQAELEAQELEEEQLKIEEQLKEWEAQVEAIKNGADPNSFNNGTTDLNNQLPVDNNSLPAPNPADNVILPENPQQNAVDNTTVVN